MSSMRCLVLVVLSLSLCVAAARADVDFAEFFVDRTMRVDYFHSGGMGQEIFALDEVVSEGTWCGSTTRLLDTLNLGKYLFSIIDQHTNRTLYSRGYATLYGEWESTGEYNETHRTFHESMRFPWPKQPFRILLEKRNEVNQFEPVWSVAIDPNSRFVNPSPPQPIGELWAVLENGDPKQKVDLLILGDGYSASEKKRFEADAKRMTNVLFDTEPFKSRKKDFNVWAITLPSEQSGVNRPRADEFHNTPLSVSYNIFDSERYALTKDNKTLRRVAAQAPYEYVEILINEKQYGGGGIFNFQATASVGAGYANYLFVHEFGHHFAALADEYYTSSVSYITGGSEHPEPWEPNITALHDPDNVKWKDKIDAATPLPTPWKKKEYEEHQAEYMQRRRELRRQKVSEEVMDAFFDENKAWTTPFLANQEYSDKVGAFEGAGYEATGLYRPEIDCIMFTRDEVGFCSVCRDAIVRVIDLYSRKGTR
jgi:hypothetical protein